MSDYSLLPDEIIYIGDTVSDIIACKEAGISCLSAAWTASDEVIRQLEANNENRVFGSIQLLKDFLMKQLAEFHLGSH